MKPENDEAELLQLLCDRLPEEKPAFYSLGNNGSITTGHAVMKLNTALGFEPVPFSELPKEERFWAGCESCCHCDILKRTNHKFCLCTGMLYVPKTGKNKVLSASISQLTGLPRIK